MKYTACVIVASALLVGCGSGSGGHRANSSYITTPRPTLPNKQPAAPKVINDINTVGYKGKAVNLNVGEKKYKVHTDVVAGRVIHYDWIVSDGTHGDSIHKYAYQNDNQSFGLLQSAGSKVTAFVKSKVQTNPIDMPRSGTVIYTGRLIGATLNDNLIDEVHHSIVDFGNKTVRVSVPNIGKVNANIHGSRFSHKTDDVTIKGHFSGDKAQSLGGAMETKTFIGAFNGEKVTP